MMAKIASAMLLLIYGSIVAFAVFIWWYGLHWILVAGTFYVVYNGLEEIVIAVRKLTTGLWPHQRVETKINELIDELVRDLEGNDFKTAKFDGEGKFTLE